MLLYSVKPKAVCQTFVCTPQIISSVTRSLCTKIDKYIKKRFIENAWLKKSVQYNSDLKSHEKNIAVAPYLWGSL